MNTQTLIIYGATGYSGRLIVQQAVARGLRPVVAGRDERAVATMAARSGLKWAIARVEEPASLRAMMASGTVLLNAAGPFSTTAIPLLEACLSTGAHYLDITGIAGSIEPVAARSQEAVHRGVMLMPAVGFEVVASDCLLAHVARRLPSATLLRLGFDKSDPTSSGSIKTTVEMAGLGVPVRRDGELTRVPPGSLVWYFDYGRGPQASFAVELADLGTAHFSTGIPNVETYMRASPAVWSSTVSNQYWGWLLATPFWQSFLKMHVDRFTPDPSLRDRSAGWGVLVAEASEATGRYVRSRLRTGDVYLFTALSAIGVVERVLAGEWSPGFQTPSHMYGPDFALSFEGAMREDL